jgi:N-acetylglucosaminyl-diphospho-decaprenol L-rhamnosyltransferase
VFVPSVDGGSMLLDSLRSLAEQTTPAECVLIDNASRDGSAAAAKREFPELRVVKLPSNRGFGPAVNLGVQRFPAQLLVFGNNDVVYEPRFLEALLDAAGDDAAVAGVLLSRHHPTTIDSAGVVVDATLLAFDHLRGEDVAAAASAPPPLGPTGAATLVKFDAFRAVGGFDPRIFAYLEDVDLALRLRAAGVRTRLAPAAQGLHRHSATLGSGSAKKNHLMGWSRGYLLRRYGILTDPRLITRALAEEFVLTTGQLIIDRTASGITGRISGWRAGRGLPRHPIATGSVIDVSLWEALRRLAGRRSLLTPARGDVD